MPGPIGHGVSKALREARDKGAYANRGGSGSGSGGGSGGPPWWAWVIAAVALIAAMVWASVTLQ